MAAVRNKDSYLAVFYRRIASRRGAKRALVAVMHKLAIAIWHVLHDQVPYRELGADFDPDAFDHVALWDAEREWIEMRLRSRTAQTVKVPALDLAVDFAAGEELRTEVSAKFRKEGVTAELAAAGLDLTHWWTDAQGRFALSLSVVR